LDHTEVGAQGIVLGADENRFMIAATTENQLAGAATSERCDEGYL